MLIIAPWDQDIGPAGLEPSTEARNRRKGTLFSLNYPHFLFLQGSQEDLEAKEVDCNKTPRFNFVDGLLSGFTTMLQENCIQSWREAAYNYIKTFER